MQRFASVWWKSTYTCSARPSKIAQLWCPLSSEMSSYARAGQYQLLSRYLELGLMVYDKNELREDKWHGRSYELIRTIPKIVHRCLLCPPLKSYWLPRFVRVWCLGVPFSGRLNNPKQSKHSTEIHWVTWTYIERTTFINFLFHFFHYSIRFYKINRWWFPFNLDLLSHEMTPPRPKSPQVIYNPTAPGSGFWPAKQKIVGGRTPEPKWGRDSQIRFIGAWKSGGQLAWCAGGMADFCVFYDLLWPSFQFCCFPSESGVWFMSTWVLKQTSYSRRRFRPACLETYMIFIIFYSLYCILLQDIHS